MPSKQSKGVLDRKNRTFYYIDSRFVNPMTAIEQVRSKMIARNILSSSRADPSSLSEYPVITYEEAEDRGYQMTPLYLSKAEASRQQEE